MFILKNEILIPNTNSQFEENNKKTVLGWLKHLYLFDEDKNGYIDVSVGYRKKYEKSIQILRKLAGLSKNDDILEWEEDTSLSKSQQILNKVIKEMS